ncbi:hypothetical protein FCV25MIE_20857 [Fagus crenata]
MTENSSAENNSPENTAEEQDLLERKCHWDNHASPNQIPDSNDVESDIEDDIDDQIPVILLSKEEKLRIQAPWRSALIIKAFGKSIGFKFMDFKIRSLWKPRGDMQCIDLGLDFFLVRFRLSEDYWHVVNDGPWSPGFRPSEAKITTTAVWTRLPELPVELYDIGILNRIGNQLGTLLKVEARTVDGERGRFARLCIQIDLDQPLTPMVHIGDINQRVQYEGISAICFHCGCVGHKAPNCPLNLPPTSAPVHASTTAPPIPPPPEKEEKGYGEWMLVTRKKFAGLKVKPKSNSPTSTENTQNPSHSDPVKGKGHKVVNNFRYDQNRGPAKNQQSAPFSPQKLYFQSGDSDISMQTKDTPLTSSKVTIPLDQSITDTPIAVSTHPNIDKTNAGLSVTPNGDYLNAQHAVHGKTTKPYSPNSNLHSDGTTILDQSKIFLQVPVGLRVTPMDLEIPTSPHTSITPHTATPQPHTPHNPNIHQTETPPTDQHAHSSRPCASQATPTTLQKVQLQNTTHSTIPPNNTHNVSLTPTCRTTSKQLGTATGRSSSPNREQSSEMATELSESFLDSSRGSTRESIEGTSSPHTGKHTFWSSDSKLDSRSSHSIPTHLSHRRDTTNLEGTQSCYPRSPSPRKSSGGNLDNFRAERHRSPRKPDNLSSHGKLSTSSTFPCEGDEPLGHRSSPTGTVIQTLNGSVQGQPESTHLLQSTTEPPSSRYSRTLSRLSSEGLILEEARDGSRLNDHHT